MAETTQEFDFNDPIRTIGADSTATFDDSSSNPTEHASSESLNAGTTLDGDTEDLEDGGGINDVDLDVDDTNTATSNLDSNGSTRITADDTLEEDEEEDEDEEDEDEEDDDLEDDDEEEEDEDDIDGNTSDDGVVIEDDEDEDDEDEDDEDEDDEDDDEVDPVKV